MNQPVFQNERPGTAGAPAFRRQDYERIEGAIRYLAEHAGEQPDLESVAEHVHLSRWHLQRLFVAWAGVSPKEFLQSLTLERAKALLEQSRSLLDTALELGLSGPSRLHDLFVGVEAVTPGEYKLRGEGLRMHWDVAETPFGRALLAATERGLCRLAFAGNANEALEALRRDWPGAKLTRDSDRLRPYVVELSDRMRGRPPTERIGVVLKGTDLRLRVWRALLEVPRGTVVSYGQLAALSDRPDAVRAVASAVAENPVAFLIPCHRVIRATGALGEYRWGSGRKAVMLAAEQAPRMVA